eukprot:scaffold1988_cov255-Pinguiococcus_pyrenoidosus.AAC.8
MPVSRLRRSSLPDCSSNVFLRVETWARTSRVACSPPAMRAALLVHYLTAHRLYESFVLGDAALEICFGYFTIRAGRGNLLQNLCANLLTLLLELCVLVLLPFDGFVQAVRFCRIRLVYLVGQLFHLLLNHLSM